MSTLEYMVEQHAMQHAAHLKHLDEASGHPQGAAASAAPQEDSLDRLAREELASAGPMGVWDALAQQAERLIERLEH